MGLTQKIIQSEMECMLHEVREGNPAGDYGNHR